MVRASNTFSALSHTPVNCLSPYNTDEERIMSTARQAVRPLAFCLIRRSAVESSQTSSYRALSTTPSFQDTVQADQSTTPSPAPVLDPNLVYTRREERKLLRTTGQVPIGSRRRRAALKLSGNIAFEQLPYQCFQEARKVLQEDRQEKVQQINSTRQRIATVSSQDASISGGERQKQIRVRSLELQVEKLKILADINDPLVKKRFEDGEGMWQAWSNQLKPPTHYRLGDLNKPIYRFLANKEWRKYRRLVLMQRITQMSVVPDVLPSIDPSVEVTIAFGRNKVQPGEFVDSRISEKPCKLKIQPFDKGERLVTIVVVDSDIPNLETDQFEYRCHYLASNIKVSPTESFVPLHSVNEASQLILPWLPPHAQKGSPYHRLSIFVLEQREGEIDVEAVKGGVERDGFILRSFMDRQKLVPVGVNMFRTQWDEGMAEVMQRHHLPGWDVELKRKRVEPLPYKKKDGARYR